MKIKGINFSTKYAAGSVTDRNGAVQKIRDKIFTNVLNEYPNIIELDASKHLPISVIKEHIKKFLPEKLKINVRRHQQNRDDYKGCLIRHINSNVLVSHYTMELPAEKNKFCIDEIPTLMHELTHLLDFAINPQHNNICEKLVKYNLIEKFKKLYEEYFYTDKKISKFKIYRTTKKGIKEMPAEEKLVFLKAIELGLKTEMNAYGCMKKYADTLRIKKQRRICYNSGYYKKLNFEKKLKLIEKMRYKIISNERKEIAKTH